MHSLEKSVGGGKSSKYEEAGLEPDAEVEYLLPELMHDDDIDQIKEDAFDGKKTASEQKAAQKKFAEYQQSMSQHLA